MTARPPGGAPLAEHLYNDKGQVMVLLPPLSGIPRSWRAFGDVVALTVRGEPPRFLALTPQAMAMATEQGWILLVEVADEPVRETWVPIEGEASAGSRGP